MTAYLDTSVLVSALSRKTGTDRAQTGLAQALTSRLLISEWFVTEFSAALSLKLRSGLMTADERAKALQALARLMTDRFERLQVTSSHFTEAARLADRHETGLRGGDALHLAICAGQGVALWLLDRRLAQAGPLSGVKTRLL